MKRIILFLFVVLFMPFNVDAVYEVIDVRCTNQLKKQLREEAQDVVYRLDRNDDNVLYTGYFYNVTDNLDLIGVDNQVYRDFKIENMKSGTAVVVNLYASNKTYCEGYKILTRIINVPYNNPYYGSDLCVGNEKFSLCAENANVSLNEDEFKKRLEKYKESLIINEDEEFVEEIIEEDAFDFFEFISEYKYYILTILGLILLVLIIVVIVSMRRNKDIL